MTNTCYNELLTSFGWTNKDLVSLNQTSGNTMKRQIILRTVFSAVLLITIFIPQVQIFSAQTTESIDNLTKTARENIAKSKSLSKDTPLLAMGILKFENGEITEAIKFFRNALTFYRENNDYKAKPESLLYLARAFSKANELTLARNSYTLLVAEYPESKLADDALYEQAHLEGKHLLSVDSLNKIFNDFAFQDPLTLDFDALIYLPGYSKGYHLEGLDNGLSGLQKVWTTYPDSDKADDALLLTACNRGFMIDEHEIAITLLNKLIKKYPHSEHVPFAILAKAFLYCSDQKFEEALETASNVEPHSKASPSASFLSGYITAYQQNDSAKALIRFKAMEQLSYNELWKGAALYHQAMTHFVLTHKFEKAQKLAIESQTFLSQFTDRIDSTSDRASIMRAAATYIAEISATINSEPDIQQARLQYALFFQGGGHPVYAAKEFEKLAGERLPPKLQSRVEYELGIIMLDDLNNTQRGLLLLQNALVGGRLSETRREEARYRIAKEKAKTEDSKTLTALKNIGKEKGPWAGAAIKELTKNQVFTIDDYDILSKNKFSIFDTNEPSSTKHKSTDSLDSKDAFMAPVLKNLAQMFENEGNLKLALEYYGRLLTLWPGATEAMARTEEKLALIRLMESIQTDGKATPDDGPLLLAIGQMLAKLDNPKEARMYLRRAKKATKDTGNENKFAFHLMEFEVKNSRSSRHGLTIVNSYLDKYPGKTKENIEALAIKASLLEKRLPELQNDEEELTRIRTQAEDIRRYLIKRGTKVAESALILGNRYMQDKEFLKALEVLERTNSLKPVPAEVLSLKAKVLLELKKYDQRKDTLYTLSTIYRESKEGIRAAELLQQQRQADLEQTVMNIESIPIIHHRLSFYLAEANDNELKSTTKLLEQLNRSLEQKEKMTTEIRLLIGKGLIRGEKFASGAKLVSIAINEKEYSQPEKIELTLLAAKAYNAGNNKTAAWELVDSIRDISTEAVYEMAQLQLTKYHDPEQALPLFEKLVNDPTTPADILGLSYLKAGKIKFGTDHEKYCTYLEKAIVQKGIKNYEITKKIAQLLNKQNETAKEVGWWLKASDNAPSANEMCECSLFAIKAMIKSHQWSRARKRASQLLSGGVPLEHRKTMQQLLKETNAREQLTSLRKGMDWNDPESGQNLANLKKMANLYISPLGDMDKARAVITQVTQIFPWTTKSSDVIEILAKIPLMIKIRELEKKARAPEDYYYLARICEDKAGDTEKAADFYALMSEEWPDHKFTPLALMYLIRLEGLVLNQSQKALEHLQQLLGSQIARRLTPRLTAFISLKAASSKLAILLKKAENNIATYSELIELGNLAATELSDPKTVKLVITKLKQKKTSKHGAWKLAVLASSSLKPQSLITPGGATPEYFINEAISLAVTKEQKARSYLLMGSFYADRRQPSKAIAQFNLAIKTGPQSSAAEDALFQTAELLETSLNDDERALSIYSEIAQKGKKPSTVQIASTRSERLTEKLAIEGLMTQTHEEAVSKKSAVLYFYTGKRLQKNTKNLEKALTAFRSYIRLGKKPPILIKSYKSVSDILVRLEKPEEAIEELEKLIAAFPEMIDTEEVLLKIAQIREVNLADYSGALEIYRRISKSSSPRKIEGEEGALRMAELKKELQRSQKIGSSAEAASEEVKNIRSEFLTGKDKDWKGASQALEDRIADTPSNWDKLPLLLELGSIQDNNLKEFEEAIETYNEFLTISTNKKRNGDIMLRTGDIEVVELKRPEDGLETYEKWLNIFFSHPRRVEVMLKVAELKETRLDRTQEALEEYIIIAASYPRSGYDEKALMRLAHLQRTYYADFQAAITAYRQITERFPFGDWSDDSQFYIARIYEIELGDFVQAKTEYQKVIDLYPTSSFTGQARDALIRIERRN